MNGYGKCAGKDLCIICNDCSGTIKTIDGMVCTNCMPKDLLSQAKSLRKHNIISFQKTFPDYISCAGFTNNVNEKNGLTNRSAAITSFTPTSLIDELNAQIASAESIDIVVSFIITSGLSLLLGSLTKFTRYGKLRVITTAYMGATEYSALVELFDLPNTEVRMELNADRTRLHAKSFIFNRSNGDSVVFVGSANISRSALTSGEEWEVKLREKDVPEVIVDLRQSYESLWNSNSIKPVTKKNRAEIEAALERRGM